MESIIITIVIVVAVALVVRSFHRKLQAKNKKNCGACDDKDCCLK